MTTGQQLRLMLTGVLVDHIEPRMANHGFTRRSKERLERRQVDYIDYIVLSFWMRPGDPTGYVDVIFQIRNIAVYNFIRSCPPLNSDLGQFRFTECADMCNVDADCGYFYHSHPFHVDSNMNNFGQMLADCIERTSLPFFDKFHDLQNVIDEYEKGPRCILGGTIDRHAMSAFACWYVIGNKVQALRALERHIQFIRTRHQNSKDPRKPHVEEENLIRKFMADTAYLFEDGTATTKGSAGTT